MMGRQGTPPERSAAVSSGHCHSNCNSVTYILVATSLHLLLSGHFCILLHDVFHGTCLRQGFLPGIQPQALDLENYPYHDLATGAIGWWRKLKEGPQQELMEVCHSHSRSLTYISFAANTLQRLWGAIYVNILKGTFFSFNADTLLRWLPDCKL